MVKLIEGGMNLTISLHLTAEDLGQIAERYEAEHQKPAPPYSSRVFQAYCREMVRMAAGAASAGGWEEGVV